MYKVLLVDDEPMIREGLKTLIPWEELGFRVIDTAVNGQDALQKCGQIVPDLMIADIRMPGMNGLELIKTVRTMSSNMHILILSGYADFEYAKQAIVHRIDGYLLKPVDEDELAEYLLKLREQLDMEYASQDQYPEVRTLEWDSAVQDLLLGDVSLSSGYAELERRFPWSCYEVVLIKHLPNGETQTVLPAMIKNKLKETFDEQERGIAFSLEPYIGIVVKDGLKDEQKLNSVYHDILAASKEHNLDFFAVSGGEVFSWSDIAISYRRALELMKNKFFLDSGSITQSSNPYPIFIPAAEQNQNLDELFGAATETLYLALEIGNLPASRQLIQNTAEVMYRCGCKEDEIKTRFVQMFSTILDKLTHNRSEMHSLEIRAGLLESYKETRYMGLIERLAAIAEGMANSMENSGTDKQIKRMIDVIHRNYGENLKLEKLAELFNYNSAYLGKLFRQATGEHFNTYLDKVRIEQAKTLLEQGLKVYQVAEKVGYANVDYFHTKFRKYVGTSPTGYKKM
ncbi:response regulator transcription factor [Cohnella mopanensis]|uniref:response regulator transcription factor n=1 Tax=Cohnella mopanensis TaxID=2911966 RepID=UPI001EF8B147|nr:response regulator transcription factor [Cohnella mopanensis]